MPSNEAAHALVFKAQAATPQTDLLSIVDRFAGARILVIGDVMLDIYRIGEATRISPEAPVPVLLNPITEYRLGGAGAVAAMCAALGAETTLVSMFGYDSEGDKIRELAVAHGIRCRRVISTSRQTTTKERICGVASGRHRQQLIRVDHEDCNELNEATKDALQAELGAVLCQGDRPDIVLISDYAKGVCFSGLVRLSIESGVETIVDPPRGGDWEKYRQAACLVPNREESNGLPPAAIVDKYQLTACVVKLDQDGCRLQDDEIPMTRGIKSLARAVHDVTNAGDQFLTVLGLARAAGASWFQAAQLANAAAGLQVERHGCVPVTNGELIAALTHDNP